MSDALAAIFWGVVTFSILVVLHEGGHFLAARAFGVRVHEFMIGLPGPALRTRRGETSYGVTAIPLGGYVRIAGMEPGPEDPRIADALAAATRRGRINPLELADDLAISTEDADALLYTLADWGSVTRDPDDEDTYIARHEPSAAEDPEALAASERSKTYRGLSSSRRIAVLSAGVIVNLVTAVLVFVVVIAGWGYFVESLVIERTLPNSAAAEIGLRAGDRITSIDGTELGTFQDLLREIGSREAGDEVTVVFVRGDAERTATAVLGKREDGAAFLGVQGTLTKVRPTVIEAFGEAFGFVGLVFRAILDFFKPETFRTSIEGARSVVGISVEVANAAKNGPLDYAWIVALLSLSLGAMNILPIPPLDGGKVAVEIVERITRRELPRRFSLGLSVAGTLLLFSLIGYLMYADVVRYVVNG